MNEFECSITTVQASLLKGELLVLPIVNFCAVLAPEYGLNGCVHGAELSNSSSN